MKGARPLIRSVAPARSGVALSQDWSERPILKELATKLAWAIGSTLHITYAEKSQTHKWAEELALRVYVAHKKALGSTI